MRTILTLIFATMLFTANAQKSYPCYEKDSTGQVLVVMTIEQAQSLDNNTDLLSLFEKMNSQIGTMDSVCLKVVNEKDHVIASQTIQIYDLKSQVSKKADEIANLQKQVNELEKLNGCLGVVIENKDKEINLHIKDVRTAKAKWGIGGGVIGIIVGLVTGILIMHH